MDVGINVQSQVKILDGPSAYLFLHGPFEGMTQLVFVPMAWVGKWIRKGWRPVYPDQMDDPQNRAVLMHPPGWGEDKGKDNEISKDLPVQKE